jgi:N-acetylglucosaminyl-diphospho-decaprenol L-rhamnosyltransferase
LTSPPEPRTPNAQHRSVAPVREITAILVSWNDAEDVLAAARSLADARCRMPGGPRVSLLVVDNGGGIQDHAGILSLWPGASILVNETNRGFGPAGNQAAELASGDVLLFLNPDTRAEGDPFSELARGFDTNPEAVALAPRLLDFEDASVGNQSQIASHKSQFPRLSPPDREDQFTFQLRRFPNLASDARELLLIDHFVPNNRGRRRARYADVGRAAPFEVEQAAAAALAVRKSVFQRLGGFDDRFVPAWFEDVDLCARLVREGKILYWPDARFRHRGGVSSAALGYSRFLPIFYRNALRYRRLHYGRAARLLYRPLLAAGMLLRLAALPIRPRVPRPRKESARAYLSTLAAALGLSNPDSGISQSKI